MLGRGGRLGFAAGIVLVVAVLGAVLVIQYRGYARERARLQEILDEARAQISQGREARRHLDAIYSEIARTDASLAALKRKLPSQPQIKEFAERLMQEAARRKIEVAIDHIERGKAIPHLPGFRRHELTVRMKGDFTEAATALDRLREERAFTLQSIRRVGTEAELRVALLSFEWASAPSSFAPPSPVDSGGLLFWPYGRRIASLRERCRLARAEAREYRWEIAKVQELDGKRKLLDYIETVLAGLKAEEPAGGDEAGGTVSAHGSPTAKPIPQGSPSRRT
jgi:Tfp pilus assembly protein PilO